MKRQLAKILRNRRWAATPICEALEGRALMAVSPLAPNFGAGGAVAGAYSLSSPVVNIAALVVQNDGKIVTAEVAPAGTNYRPSAILAIRRYNPNGALDTTFGTGGQTNIPFTGTNQRLFTPPRNLVIDSKGNIVLATEGAGNGAAQDVVIRLTSSGALDPSFGTGGEYLLPAAFTHANTVAVTSSGRVLVAGFMPGTDAKGGTSGTNPQTLVFGLTTAGAIDPTFGAGGVVSFTLPSETNAVGNTGYIGSTLLSTTPGGSVLLSLIATGPGDSASEMIRLRDNGAIDRSFGDAGEVTLYNTFITDLVVQPDATIIVAGSSRPIVGSTVTAPFLIKLDDIGRAAQNFAPTLGFGPQADPTQSIPGFQAVALGPNGTIITTKGGSDVERFLANGLPDRRFGLGGQLDASVPGQTTLYGDALATAANGNILIGGLFTGFAQLSPDVTLNTSQTALVQVRPINQTAPANDYNGDGVSDLAAELTQYGAFASRPLGASTATIQPFGDARAGATIPAPGDYDGDGTTDLAAYLPRLGLFAYRPSHGGADVYTQFQPPGETVVPVPGDYDGDGRTDVAFFLSKSANFVVFPSSGAAPFSQPFGANAGGSIPAPGDYDGDGQTDLAVYLPASGVLTYRPSSVSLIIGVNTDVAIQFGAPGAGSTLIAPGDYDGDGRTDVAGYLPNLGVFAYRPSGGGGGADVIRRFGPTGPGAALPVPGDYDGDGRTDVALFLPDGAVYAIAPSSGAPPTAIQFGAAGAGNTMPATVVPLIPSTVSALSFTSRAALAAGDQVAVALTEDLIANLAPRRRKV